MEILHILNEVNHDLPWENILNNIEDWVGEYYDEIAKKGAAPEQYLREVLPQYWQVVRAHNTYKWDGTQNLPSQNNYDVGIFLIGFSSLPIALSIAEIQPRQKIYFLHSEDTEPKCNEITDRIKEMLADPPVPFTPLICPCDANALIDRVQAAKRCEIASPSDPVEIFKQIKEIIDNVRGTLGSDTNIALDLTGGKKTMIGGGFTAGSIYAVSPKCDMFYVDSLEYDVKRGVPIPGTEFLSRLDNPYNVYNVQSVGQAKELFKRHNYAAAENLWKSVRNGLYRHTDRYHFLTHERQEAVEYYGSSHCYHPWDALDYETAAQRKTYHFNNEIHSWGYKDQHVHRTIDVLNILADVSDKHTLFAKKDTRIIHYAVDRYQNGMRRKQSGRLDDAIVRFAQVIEMLCNYRIYRLAQDKHFLEINTHTPKYLSADEKWEFKPLIRLLFGTGSVKLENVDCYVSSNGKMNIIEYGYNSVDQIIDIIQPRNDFIHFNTLMNQAVAGTNVEKLRKLALKFLKDFSEGYCHQNGLNFKDLLELHKFRR